jgi:hypothetical protein
VVQTAACNAGHTLEQRLARWLLLARHRIGSDELPLTHEFLSMMLAVRRAGVTVATGTLQQGRPGPEPPRACHLARSRRPRGGLLRVLPPHHSEGEVLLN